MDTVLNKLKTKVSTALPGNPVTREYDLGKSIGYAGPGMLWKLFAAKKRSTQQDATVWEFDKKSLESCSKAMRESVLDSLRNGVASLTRIRHPKIVSVLQPLEESRDSLAFVTEPLFTSLKSALFQGLSQQQQKYTAENIFILKDVEIKYGLMQIAEALNFIHSDCHRVHLNLVPESIVINKVGLWKLAGLEFSKVLQDGANSALPSVSVSPWQPSTFSASQPSLVFCSPEAVLQGHVTPASDMFSLGLLICCLFNRGQSLFDNENDLAYYKRSMKDIPSVFPTKIASLPENLREYVRMMLHFDPEIRPTALQFSRTPYFEDAAMSVLRSVDNIYQLDNLARSQFYKSLPNTMQTLPKRLCLFRVYPQITEDFSNPHMVPFILPAVLQIMNMVTQEEFVNYMLPRLIPVLSMKDPIQIVLVLLQNLHILSAKFPLNEFRTHVLPIVHSALDIDNRMIQELCLNSLPQISKNIELTVLKNAVLPRIEKLFFRSEILSLRINCLVCVGKLLDHLDRWVVMDDVLPFLQRIRSREPAILVMVLAIYRIAFSHEKLGISCEHLATRVLPHLIPLSIESGLNLQQYLAYAELIRDMCSRLERDQRAKLEQLHVVSDSNNLIGLGSDFTTEWISTNSCSDLIDRVVHTYLDSSLGLIKPNASPNGSSIPRNGSDRQAKPTETSLKPNELTLEQKRQLAAQRSQAERLIKEPNPSNSDPFVSPTSVNRGVHIMDSCLNDLSATFSASALSSPPRFTRPPMNQQPVSALSLNNKSQPVLSSWNTPLMNHPRHSVPPLRPVMQLSTAGKQNPSQNFRPLSKSEIDELLNC